MLKRVVFLIAALALVGCASETVNESQSDSIELDCGWIMPSDWHEMTRAEYETWLRDEMPHTTTGCQLPDEQIRRVMESFESDQASQRRWKQHFDMIDVMANQRAVYREITDDEFISPSELLYLCAGVEGWQAELNDITDFLAEYRSAEPEFFDKNESLSILQSETQKLQDWNSSLLTRCGD